MDIAETVGMEWMLADLKFSCDIALRSKSSRSSAMLKEAIDVTFLSLLIRSDRA